MKNRLFVNNNTIILFLFIIGSFLFIELNFRYWYRFLEQYMMFQTAGSYFQDRLAEPGGLNEYVTEFLGEAFPVLYQEAICLFFAAVQKDPEAFRSFPISQEVENRFLQFMKVARSMPPAALKQQFGDTYYYYAQFIPTPKRQ